jgi:dTDP-glucose pyrophosphorylase
VNPTPGERLRQSCVSIDGTLLDVLRSLEASNAQIALVIDESTRLQGVVTDGDIRRALLRGASLDAPVRGYTTTRFVSVDPQTSRDRVLDLMQARVVGQIPVLERDGRVVGLHLLRELVGGPPRANWALVMAGGKGLRLRPVTEYVPKPMLEVAGRPILERIILHLVGYGIQRIFLSVNYLAEVIERHFGDGERFGCRIEYLREDKPLGTGGALSLLPAAPEMPMLALNGDLVAQWDVERLIGFHDTGGFAATVAIHEYAHTVPFGVLTLDGTRVVDMQEKPTFSWRTNAGIYVLSPEVIARVPKDTEFPLPGLLEDCVSRGESVGAFPLEGDWIDVGRQTELRRARGETDKT